MKNKPDIIFTADWHLRDDQPECWTGDFWSYQELVLDWLIREYKSSTPIIVAGDLFHKAKPSPFLLSYVIRKLNNLDIVTVSGNHDLPYHNISKFAESGLSVLDSSAVISSIDGDAVSLVPSTTVYGFPWQYDEKHIVLENEEDTNIAIVHEYCYKGKKPFPGVSTDSLARKIMKKFKDYNIIVTGDNHQSFTVEFKDQILINPGCLIIQRSDEIEYEPSIYEYYVKENKVKRVKIPQPEAGSITRQHNEDQFQREERINKFIEHLKRNYETGLSFEKNLEQFFQKNKVSKEVQNKVWKSVES